MRNNKSTKLKVATIKKFQKIIKKDYGMAISKEVADELGYSLLKLTRLAIKVSAREMKKKK